MKKKKKKMMMKKKTGRKRHILSIKRKGIIYILCILFGNTVVFELFSARLERSASTGRDSGQVDNGNDVMLGPINSE